MDINVLLKNQISKQFTINCFQNEDQISLYTCDCAKYLGTKINL